MILDILIYLKTISYPPISVLVGVLFFLVIGFLLAAKPTNHLLGLVLHNHPFQQGFHNLALLFRCGEDFNPPKETF